jgi:hypothetical protein
MSDPRFKWRRFWHRRDSAIAYDQDGYFLAPSVGQRESNPNALSFDLIAPVHCLVLLGEPGAGKSCSLKQECAKLDDLTGQDELSYWFDLNYPEHYLIEELTGDERFKAWQEGQCQLHLFLDSLDECPIRIDRMVKLVLRTISQKGSVERLFLRIICRTGYWKSSLEKDLQRHFKDVQVYELASLSREDVRLAAEEREQDPAAFLREVGEKGAVPLAIKPLSLEFLLKCYVENQRLPDSQSELYQDGCKMLCTEPVETRQDHADYPAKDLFLLATRVAYVTIFSGRPTIATDAKETCQKPLGECVTIEDLSGGTEMYDGGEIEANEHAIRNLLKTPLFALAKTKRAGWSHHSYAEFLAALYAVRTLAFEQIMNIIVQSDDPQKRLIPQLQETAAWIATMNSRVFDAVITADPAVLVMSDVATVKYENRSRLVDALLNSCQKRHLVHLKREVMRDWYKRLNFSGFDDQIRDYVRDKTKALAARLFAVSIASAGELQSVEEELVQAALDQSEEFLIREEAGYAILKIGSEEAKRGLKELALGKSDGDPDDQLKGVGFKATWPKHIAAKELFDNLTPPKNEFHIGAYYDFIQTDLLKYLKPKDLSVALAWAEKQLSLRSIPDSFRELSDSIIIKALQNFEAAGVLDGIAKIVRSCVTSHANIVSQKSHSLFQKCLNTGKRQQILEKSIALLSDSPKKLRVLAFLGPSIIFSSDVPWLLRRLADTPHQGLKLGLAELILTIFDRQDPEQIDLILTLIEAPENEDIATIFVPLVKQVELDASQAQELREAYKAQQEIEQLKEGALLTPSPAERISMLLSLSEDGKSEAWAQLVRDMTLNPRDTHYHDEFEPDVRTLPGWEGSNKETRARIVIAARSYLLKSNPQTYFWLGKRNPGLNVLAGFKAIALLLHECPEAVSPAVLKKWTPAILAYPQFGEEHAELHKTFTELAYRYAPDEVVASIGSIIDVEDRQGLIAVLRKLERCWDDTLCKVVLDKAKDCKLSSRGLGSILDLLLDRGLEEAQQFIESLISLTEGISALDLRRRSKAVEAASVGMMHAVQGRWSVMWSAITQDPEFGRAVFESMAIAHRLDQMKIANLDEGELADLYVWLNQQFPYEEDQEVKGAHYVTPRETIQSFRYFTGQVLLKLVQKGTPKAVQKIRELASELPEHWQAQQLLAEALRSFRLNAWVPLEPTALLELARNKEARSAESGEQLLDVLMESLNRLQDEIWSETQTVFFLWNECKKGRQKIYTPKSEEEFSDWIKLHLDRDLRDRGIISHREVKIRRCTGPENRGQITDLYVNAVRKKRRDDFYDSIPVIIEVKGSFNKRIKKDIKEQLVDRYLKDNYCNYGLYVIYWPLCAQWDDRDKAKKRPLKDIERAKRNYARYASDLSQGSVQIKACVIDTGLK